MNKGYTEGLYSDTPANRKLGRVGMSYKKYLEKVKDEKGKEDKSASEFKKDEKRI